MPCLKNNCLDFQAVRKFLKNNLEKVLRNKKSWFIFVLSITNKEKNAMTNAMYYPGEHAARHIKTCFVDSIKFSIYEVIPALYAEIFSQRERFFLLINDSYIYGQRLAEIYFEKTGECRWDFFCTTKGGCEQAIKAFDEQAAYYKRLVKDSRRVEAAEKALFLKKRVFDLFNINLQCTETAQQ